MQMRWLYHSYNSGFKKYVPRLYVIDDDVNLHGIQTPVSGPQLADSGTACGSPSRGIMARATWRLPTRYCYWRLVGLKHCFRYQWFVCYSSWHFVLILEQQYGVCLLWSNIPVDFIVIWNGKCFFSRPAPEHLGSHSIFTQFQCTDWSFCIKLLCQ